MSGAQDLATDLEILGFASSFCCMFLCTFYGYALRVFGDFGIFALEGKGFGGFGGFGGFRV